MVALRRAWYTAWMRILDLFVAAIVVVTACEPPSGPSGDTGDTADPNALSCVEPQNGVGEIEPSFLPRLAEGQSERYIEADCVIVERMTSDVQDGLILQCDTADGPLDVTLAYLNGQLLLPDSAAVGLAVSLRYRLYEAESASSAAIVRAKDDGRVVLALLRGGSPQIAVDGLQAPGFWAPFAIDRVATDCATEAGNCSEHVRRAALELSVDGEKATLFDHQVGHVGPYDVHVGAVTADSGAYTGQCDGGSDGRVEFVIVHGAA